MVVKYSLKIEVEEHLGNGRIEIVSQEREKSAEYPENSSIWEIKTGGSDYVTVVRNGIVVGTNTAGEEVLNSAISALIHEIDARNEEVKNSVGLLCKSKR